MMNPDVAPLCGILLLDKPLGLSSNAALQRVRFLLGRPKAGHTGSLDPLATGMLPICVGEATKLAGELLAGRKAYRFEMKLGERTDSADAEGQIIERLAVPRLDPVLIEAALASQRGAQQQVPPMYSALKRDGEPLYKLARQGLSVDRAARAIEIYALELLDFSADTLRCRVECSKGTYIRTLAEQIAARLGTCAHVIALRRDFVEPFAAESMITLEALQALHAEGTGAGESGVARGAFAALLLPADRAVGHLPAHYLTSAQARALVFGQTVLMAGPAADPVRLYDAAGQFMGLGAQQSGGVVRVKRLFVGQSVEPM